jgi:hypothetical protein
MRKHLALMMVATVLYSTSASLLAGQDVGSESEQVKNRQKEESKALVLKQKFQKDSMKALPRAERLRVQHEMQKESRELRERQKNERQELKDRQRVMKDSVKRL